MKIRTDFVTNSSSSSFVIDLTVENASGEKCTLASFYKDYCDEGYSARRTIGPKTLSGQCGHNDPDTSFDPEGWWTVFDDLTGEESSALDGYSDEDYDLLAILGNKDVRDVERVLNKMISGTAITDADENAIKSLIERALETNNISLKEIDIYCIGEELELSGDFDMMEPSDFLGWDDALKASNADIEMLARRYKTDVESMRIFLDMRGHTYLTRRENVKNVRTGETFLRHIIYPSIYKDSRDTEPLPIPFYNGSSSSNEKSEVTDDKSAGFEDFEVLGNVLVKYLGKFAEAVVIPRELGVKTIGERAFAENEEITSVTIPEGVEVIAKEAFYFARNIEEIILPSTLKRIGNSAFCGCGALEKIELPEGVKEIADGVFSFTGLTTLNIPKSLTQLGGKDPDDLTARGVLSNSKIKHFEFPSGWTEVPDNMFSFCQELVSVILPDTITHIGSSAFSYCTSLASIDLPSNLKVVGHSAFSRTAIEIIELPASVTEIGDRCFEESSLKELSLPDSVTVIPWYFCKNSEFLTTVSWGAGVKIINNEAFHGCRKLKTLPVLTNVESIGNTAFAECKALTEINLGNRLTKIGSRVFAGSKRIKKITIPGTVSLIGGRITEDTGANLIVSFENTNGWLKHSTLKDAEAGINGRAIDFSNETSNAELLSKKAFYSCASPKKPKSDIDIRKPPIVTPAKNTDLNTVPTSKEAVSIDTAVETSIKATPSTSAVPKVVSSTESTIVRATNETPAGDFEIKGTVLVKYNGTSTIVGIPEKVKEIGASAFAGNQKIEEVILHEKVKKIGSLSFSGCGKLRAVSLGYGLQSIENQAFYECFSLESVEIGEQISSIASNAFCKCNSLKFNTYDCALYIGNSFNPYIALMEGIDKSIVSCEVHSDTVLICEYAFKECVALDNLIIPEGVKTLETGAFSDCKSLHSIKIPDSVTSIGNHCFWGSGLSSVFIGKGLTEIRGFENCEKLVKVLMSEGATAIKTKAFHLCKNLKEVHLPSTITKIENYAFERCYNFEKAVPFVIFIPDSVKNISKAAFGSPYNLDVVKIVTTQGSCADEFAKENGIEVSYDYILKSELAGEIPVVTTYVDAVVSSKSISISDTSINAISSIDRNAGFYKKGKELYNAGRYSDALKEFECVESDYLDVANLRAECRIKLEEEKNNSNAYDSGKNLYNSGKYQEALTAWAILSDTYRDVKIMREKCRQQLSGMASVISSTSSTPSTFSTLTQKTSKASSNPKISKTTKIAIAVGVVLTIIAIIIFSAIRANSDEALYEWEELPDGTVKIFGVENGSINRLLEDGVLTIPSEIDGKKVTSIYDDYFSTAGFQGALKIIIPDGVTYIGKEVFLGCSSLETVVIPQSVTVIGEGAFQHCSSLKNVTLPPKLKTIEDSVFCGCSSLESIEIPDSVATIGDSAFWGCSSLKRITFGSGVTKVGSIAFGGCEKITRVDVNSLADWCEIDFDGLSSSPLTYATAFFVNGSSITQLVVSKDIERIGSFSFSQSSFLTSIEIGEGVTEIGDGAFYGCKNVSEIIYNAPSLSNFERYHSTFYKIGDEVGGINLIIGNKVKRLPALIFSADLNGLTSSSFKINNLTFEEESSLEEIGSGAFSDSLVIKSIVIPKTLKKIESGAFAGARELSSVYISDLESWCGVDVGGLGSIWPQGINLYINNQLVTKLVIPDTITDISNNIFSNFISITSVTLPSGAKRIGDYAFNGCSAVTSVKLPDGLEEIGIEAFGDCISLHRIVISQNVSQMDRDVFYGCENITVYCKMLSKPYKWDQKWQRVNSKGKSVNIVWGYKD